MSQCIPLSTLLYGNNNNNKSKKQMIMWKDVFTKYTISKW
jgi:hypothetical protein